MQRALKLLIWVTVAIMAGMLFRRVPHVVADQHCKTIGAASGYWAEMRVKCLAANGEHVTAEYAGTVLAAPPSPPQEPR